MKKLLFFCISLAIVLFSIIVTNVAPIIKGRVGNGWSYMSCKYYADSYNNQKKALEDLGIKGKDKDKALDPYKKAKTRCDRRQAMNGLEYVTSNLNIIFGFICAFAGFLLYQGIGNLGNDGKYIGLIGLALGVIGFVLTLVYVIHSGLVFTDIAEDEDGDHEIRIDSDGAFLEWNSGKKKFTCIYYKEDDKDSSFLRYSDYGNKYLNYKKEIYFEENEKYKYCNYENFSSNRLRSLQEDGDDNYPYNDWPYAPGYGSLSENNIYTYCEELSKKDSLTTGDMYYYSLGIFYGENANSYTNEDGTTGTCNKIYYFNRETDNEYKVTYDYWLTSLIFSCLIMALHIGLALFGFLLFSENGSSSGPVTIK